MNNNVLIASTIRKFTLLNQNLEQKKRERRFIENRIYLIAPWLTWWWWWFILVNHLESSLNLSPFYCITSRFLEWVTSHRVIKTFATREASELVLHSGLDRPVLPPGIPKSEPKVSNTTYHRQWYCLDFLFSKVTLAKKSKPVWVKKKPPYSTCRLNEEMNRLCCVVVFFTQPQPHYSPTSWSSS